MEIWTIRVGGCEYLTIIRFGGVSLVMIIQLLMEDYVCVHGIREALGKENMLVEI